MAHGVSMSGAPVRIGCLERDRPVVPLLRYSPDQARGYRADVVVGLMRRIEEMLLSLMPLAVAFG